jgi:hypothetical protein
MCPISEVGLRKRHVRFTPDSYRTADIVGGSCQTATCGVDPHVTSAMLERYFFISGGLGSGRLAFFAFFAIRTMG